MAVMEPVPNELRADLLVVGGGPAGMTAAIETAEIGRQVILLERQPSLGGRVAASFQYFPKLCPPTCGIEINLKRIRINPNIRVLTLAEVEKISGLSGDYTAQVRLQPRYVNEKCTACGDCAKVCEIEREDEFNYGMNTTRAIYLPHLMAYPFRYVVDPKYATDERMRRCVDACQYGAIDLDMQPQTISVKAGAIVWATGWKPYDASKIDNLGFGRVPNVI
ncbi:MAG: FAD-dependent oxidoreductase, partial [Candidatus Zixiibacteriota bacterium]